MTPTTVPHRCRPDVIGEPGYRPHCPVCGQAWPPNPIPTPRQPS